MIIITAATRDSEGIRDSLNLVGVDVDVSNHCNDIGEAFLSPCLRN